MIENTLNITNITIKPISNIDVCMKAGGYDPACLNKWFCPQISDYAIQYGIGIIVFWIGFSWVWWWIKTKGIQRIDWDIFAQKFPAIFNWLGDPRKESTIIYWDLFVRDKFIKFMLGYVAVLVYFFLK